MPNSISLFLRKLADDPDMQAQWADETQRLTLMQSFGLQEPKLGILLDALASGSLGAVEDEVQGEQKKPSTAFIWIRV